MVGFYVISDRQRRAYLDTVQTWGGYTQARTELSRLPIGMYWRRYKNLESLTKTFYDPMFKVPKNRTIGARSVRTEEIKREFEKAKSELKERVKSLRGQIDEQAKVNKALSLGHITRVPARILVKLEAFGLLGRNLTVVGTHAMFAYEAITGVNFRTDMMETRDIDLMMDAYSKLRLRVHDAEPVSILHAIQKADPSFRIQGGSGFSASNKTGFLVEVIKPEPKPPWKNEPRSLFDGGDFLAAGIKGLEWLKNAPKVDTVCISTDGFPVPIIAPDPRVYSLYKLWMATQAPYRNDLNRRKDLLQSEAVAGLIQSHMPEKFRFSDQDLQMFPKRIRDLGKEKLSDFW